MNERDDASSNSKVSQKINASVVIKFKIISMIEARMMLLSKEPISFLKIGRIRPIQMYMPLSRAAETTCDWIDGHIIMA